MSKSRLGSLLLVSLLVVLPLAYGEETVEAKVTIKFMFWGAPGGEGDMWNDIVKEFNKTRPDIEIEPLHTPSGYEEKLVTMIAGGVAPDVFLIEEEPYPTLVRSNAFLELTSFFERDLDARKYNQVALRFLRVNGRYYALPWDLGLGIMFHNVTMLERAGLQLPPIDFTWDTFLEHARKTTRDTDGDGKIDQWGFAVSTSFRSTAIYFIWGSGGDLVDNPVLPTRVTVAEPPAVRGLRFLTELVLSHRVAPAPGQPQPSFVSGNLAMERNGTWQFVNYRPVIRDFKWDVTFTPRHPDVPQSGGYLGPDNIAISRQTRYPEAAWEFVKFVLGPRGQQIIGTYGRSIPALNEAAARNFLRPDAPPANARAIVLASEGYGRLVPHIVNFRQMEAEWSVETRAMLSGELAPESTALRIKAITERYLRAGT